MLEKSTQFLHDQEWGLEAEDVLNVRQITQVIPRAMGQLIGATLLLCVAACIMLLMPGMAVISWINDLTGASMSAPALWLWSLLASLGVFFLIFALARDSQRAGKVYGGMCIGVLILCIILSAGFQLHFFARWVRLFMGE